MSNSNTNSPNAVKQAAEIDIGPEPVAPTTAKPEAPA